MSLGSYMVRDIHVSASNRDVVRHVSRKINQPDRFSREKRDVRHQVFRDALAAHQDHRDLCAQFRL